jgi:hypothetical protein
MSRWVVHLPAMVDQAGRVDRADQEALAVPALPVVPVPLVVHRLVVEIPAVSLIGPPSRPICPM